MCSQWYSTLLILYFIVSNLLFNLTIQGFVEFQSLHFLFLKVLFYSFIISLAFHFPSVGGLPFSHSFLFFHCVFNPSYFIIAIWSLLPKSPRDLFLEFVLYLQTYSELIFLLRLALGIQTHLHWGVSVRTLHVHPQGFCVLSCLMFRNYYLPGVNSSQSARLGALCHSHSIGLIPTYTWGLPPVTNIKSNNFFSAEPVQGYQGFCHVTGPMAGLFPGPLFQRSRKTCVAGKLLSNLQSLTSPKIHLAFLHNH